jgi:hypothetical protein
MAGEDLVLGDLQAIASERGTFKFGVDVGSVVMFAVAAKAKEIGDD